MRGIVVCVSLCITAGVHPPAAAAEPRAAVIGGVVTAADGARLPGVSLLLTNQHSGAVVGAVSTDAGVFRISDVPPGGYALTAELGGFEPHHVRDIVLAAGQHLSLTLRLEVATVRELVRVAGAAPRDSIETLAIRESAARDVGEALTTLPGLTMVRKGAIANDVVLRGLRGKDVAVVIDGQRVDGACPGRMDPPVFHVDFAEVGRIEVSKGPFDVRHQGGLGGTVSVVPHAFAGGWHGAGNLMAGSAATLAGSAATSVARGQWALLGGVSSRRSDPYRDGAGVPLTGRTNYRGELADGLRAYDVWTAWGRVSVVPRSGTTLNLSYTRQSAGTIVYPYLQMDALSDNADRVGARLRIADLPAGWGGLDARAYYTRVEHWMTDEYRTSSRNMVRPYSMATDAGTETAGATVELQRGALTMGAELSHRRWNARTMLAMRQYTPQASLADATIDVAGGFASLSRDVGSELRLEAGGRLDRAASSIDPSLANTAMYVAYHGTAETRATDLVPVGYARGAWRPQDGWMLVLGVGHGARLPDQQERYYALQRKGTDWVGNPRLSPSRNTGVDAELRRTWNGVDVALLAFAYRIHDSILVVDRPRLDALPGIMNTVARSYTNVDAFVRGLEATAAIPLGRQLFFSADWAWTRGTTAELTAADRNLPEMPPARVRARLRFDNARCHALGELVGAAAQNRIAPELNESPTPAHAIANLRGGIRLRRLDLAAGLDNVLGALYAEHLSYYRDPFGSGARVYEAGRTLTVNVSAKF